MKPLDPLPQESANRRLQLSFYKNNPFTLHDRKLNLQFRAEVFNIFNTPQFDLQGASTDVTSPQFGQILQAGSERNVDACSK